MPVNINTWPEWRPRTLTDRRNDITTVRHQSGAAGLSPKEIKRPHSSTVEVLVTEAGGERKRIQFTVSSAPIPKWLAQVVDAGSRLLLLPHNWDQQGAPRVLPITIESALDALCLFMEGESSLPQWTPTREGGVQLDWHERGIDLEIEFSPSSLEGHAVFSDQHGRYAEWDGPVAENIVALRSLFSEVLK